jgi:His/Glu/Gln/Arg/opine family amino acid ABC transporter permease subunit
MTAEPVLTNLPYLLRGALCTVEISIAVVLLGTAGGIGAGLLSCAPWRAVRTVTGAVIELVRAVPLLLLLFFIFFGLPAIGVQIATFPAAIVALSLWMTVNAAEVVRGGIQSIPRGQADAAAAMGLSWRQAMRHVIFPQALRRMLPPYAGLCTILIKDTSLAAIIGVFELTRAAQETIERTFQSFEIYLVAAAMYFCLAFPLSLLSRRLEARLQRG